MSETSTPQYVSGDWEWNGTLDAYETAYEVVSLGAPWNGFATPVVSHDVMDALIGRQQMLTSTDDEWQRFGWDGNGVIVRSSDPDIDDEWLMPDENGNFDLGTWSLLGEDDRAVRRIGARESVGR